MIGNAYYESWSSVRRQDTMPGQSGDSFSSPVIKRILRILLENGELKKSNLCSKAGLNYKVCTRYVDFLAKLRWVEIREEGDRSARISIPSEGIENLRKLETDSGSGHQSVATHSVASFSGKLEDKSGVVETRSFARKERETTLQKKSRIGSTSDRKKKILIIDDDENALSTYSAFLESDKSLEVSTFSTSKKALEHLTRDPDSSDLIILDIRMPGMSGLRLFQAIKAINPSTTIIFLSSLDAAPELSELFSDPRLGNSNFLRKPVSRANFIEAVQRAVS